MRIRGYPEATPCWFELISSDPAASIAFYGGLFGWSTRPTDSPTSTFVTRDLVVAGVSPTSSPGQRSGWLTFIASDDPQDTLDKAVAAAGSVVAPVTEVGGRGRMAMVADPEGAVFGVWQHGTFAGAQVGSEPNAVCWAEVGRRDGVGAASFYGGVFGWVERAGELATGLVYSEWLSGSRVVAGMVPMTNYPPEVPAHWRLIFEVDNCVESIARVRELGGQVPVGPMDVVVGQYAQVVDPQGAAFGIIELVPQLRNLEY